MERGAETEDRAQSYGTVAKDPTATLSAGLLLSRQRRLLKGARPPGTEPPTATSGDGTALRGPFAAPKLELLMRAAALIMSCLWLSPRPAWICRYRLVRPPVCLPVCLPDPGPDLL